MFFYFVIVPFESNILISAIYFRKYKDELSHLFLYITQYHWVFQTVFALRVNVSPLNNNLDYFKSKLKPKPTEVRGYSPNVLLAFTVKNKNLNRPPTVAVAPLAPSTLMLTGLFNTSITFLP